MKLTTPVAFFVFNRPHTTVKVFAAIRQAQPSQLLIIADGARPDRVGESEKCQQVRSICDRIDWACEVKRNYADLNLGCKNRVSSGLDWVFSEVEEAIILEDDCLPDPSFFPFCQELLAKYRSDRRVMSISGDNYLFGKTRTEYSYYFSIYSDIWGWATWRRAWQYYDLDMSLFPTIQAEGKLTDILSNNRKFKKLWERSLDHTYQGAVDTWDYQWVFACFIQSGLTIIPNVNLISNIGFDENATHTTYQSHLVNTIAQPLPFPLIHPPFVITDTKSDQISQNFLYSQSLITKLITKSRSIFRKARKILGLR